MEPTQLLEASTFMQSLIKSPTRHAFRIRPNQMQYKSPNGPFRSHSRMHMHRSLQPDHRCAPLDTHPTSGESTQSRPRLRRIPAFSDLAESVSSGFAPVVSVFVAKEEWLGHSIAKTKKLIGDKEGAEQIAHQVRAVASFEYLDLGGQSPPLRRKRNSEDLRSEYRSDNRDGARSPPIPSLPLSSDNAGPPDSAHGYTTSVTISSDISSFDRAHIDFICVWVHACNFNLGELVVCAACGEWLSAGFESAR